MMNGELSYQHSYHFSYKDLNVDCRLMIIALTSYTSLCTRYNWQNWYFSRGVDNGSAGAAAAALIIWLDVVIQKWRAFRRPTRSVNVSAGLLGRGHNGLVRNMCHIHGLRVWQSPVDYLIVLCNDYPDDQYLYCSNYNPAFMVFV